MPRHDLGFIFTIFGSRSFGWLYAPPSGAAPTHCVLRSAHAPPASPSARRPHPRAATGTQQVCLAPPAEGATCTTGNPCDGLADFCDPTTLKCVAEIAVGGACPSGVGCVDYATCDSVSATCVARGKAGEACDVNTPFCLGSLQCTTAGLCALRAAAPICP